MAECLALEMRVPISCQLPSAIYCISCSWYHVVAASNIVVSVAHITKFISILPMAGSQALPQAGGIALVAGWAALPVNANALNFYTYKLAGAGFILECACTLRQLLMFSRSSSTWPSVASSSGANSLSHPQSRGTRSRNSYASSSPVETSVQEEAVSCLTIAATGWRHLKTASMFGLLGACVQIAGAYISFE